MGKISGGGVGGSVQMGDPLTQMGGSSGSTTIGTTSTPVGGTSTSAGSTSAGSTSDGAATTGEASTSSGGSAAAMTTGFVTAGSGGQMGTTTAQDMSTTGVAGQAAGGTSAMGGSGGSATSGEPAEWAGTVEAHNQARRDVNAMPPLGDLVWSDDLAAVAQDWADTITSTQCGSISHRPNGDYGENIAATQAFGGSMDPFSGPEAVDFWVAELDCYTYGTIAGSEGCDQGCISDLNSNGCGHYTQVVWRDTEAVGCGYSSCQNGNSLFEVIVCNYDPPGNFVGETPY